MSQYSLSEGQLRAHLAHLKAYVVEGFEELETRLRSGRAIPRRYVVLTVDDGHESSMRMAEILEEHRCGATFFLTRDRSLRKAGFIREREIRELRRRGFSLGAHGTSHRKLTFMSEARCIEELKGSRQWLGDVIGEDVRYMAAPGGYINARVLELAREQGYALIGTCNEWMNSSRTVSQFGKVNRVNIRRQFSAQAFGQIIDGALSFYFRRQVRAAALAMPKQLLRD